MGLDVADGSGKIFIIEITNWALFSQSLGKLMDFLKVFTNVTGGSEGSVLFAIETTKCFFMQMCMFLKILFCFGVKVTLGTLEFPFMVHSVHVLLQGSYGLVFRFTFLTGVGFALGMTPSYVVS